jgi:membrane protein YdbS with pleckstrin-like domain
MTTVFSNSVILPENLPAIEDAGFNPVDPKYLKLLYFNHLIAALVFGLSLLGFLLMTKDQIPGFILWISAGLFVGIMVYSLVITRLSFSKRGYLIRERDIAYQRGLIRYKLTSIPFNRIQHVELIQSLIAKRMGLATIKVYTAGSSSDDLEIPGLPLGVAGQIREYLTGKISPDEQD